MVSSLNLAYMHLRLEELFGGHDWFGSKSIVCFGDLLQLPPVNGSPVFQTVSRKSLCHKLAVQLLLTYGKNPWSMMS